MPLTRHDTESYLVTPLVTLVTYPLTRGFVRASLVTCLVTLVTSLGSSHEGANLTFDEIPEDPDHADPAVTIVTTRILR